MMHFEGMYVQNNYHAYLLRRIVMLKAEADVLAEYNQYVKDGIADSCFANTLLISRAAMRFSQVAAQPIFAGTTIPAAIVRA